MLSLWSEGDARCRRARAAPDGSTVSGRPPSDDGDVHRQAVRRRGPRAVGPPPLDRRGRAGAPSPARPAPDSPTRRMIRGATWTPVAFDGNEGAVGQPSRPVPAMAALTLHPGHRGESVGPPGRGQRRRLQPGAPGGGVAPLARRARLHRQRPVARRRHADAAGRNPDRLLASRVGAGSRCRPRKCRRGCGASGRWPGRSSDPDGDELALHGRDPRGGEGRLPRPRPRPRRPGLVARPGTPPRRRLRAPAHGHG